MRCSLLSAYIFSQFLDRESVTRALHYLLSKFASSIMLACMLYSNMCNAMKWSNHKNAYCVQLHIICNSTMYHVHNARSADLDLDTHERHVHIIPRLAYIIIQIHDINYIPKSLKGSWGACFHERVDKSIKVLLFYCTCLPLDSAIVASPQPPPPLMKSLMKPCCLFVHLELVRKQ